MNALNILHFFEYDLECTVPKVFALLVRNADPTRISAQDSKGQFVQFYISRPGNRARCIAGTD